MKVRPIYVETVFIISEEIYLHLETNRQLPKEQKDYRK